VHAKKPQEAQPDKQEQRAQRKEEAKRTVRDKRAEHDLQRSKGVPRQTRRHARGAKLSHTTHLGGDLHDREPFEDQIKKALLRIREGAKEVHPEQGFSGKRAESARHVAKPSAGQQPDDAGHAAVALAFHSRHRRYEVAIEKPRRRDHVCLVVDDGLHQGRDISWIELAVAVDMEQNANIARDRDPDSLLKRRAEPSRCVVPDNLGSRLSRPIGSPIARPVVDDNDVHTCNARNVARHVGDDATDGWGFVKTRDDDEQAERMAAPIRLAVVRNRTGRRAPIASVEEALAYRYTREEEAIADEFLLGAIIGGPQRVLTGLTALARDTGADELLLSTLLPGREDRLHSYERVSVAAGLYRTSEDPLPAT